MSSELSSLDQYKQPSSSIRPTTRSVSALSDTEFISLPYETSKPLIQNTKNRKSLSINRQHATPSLFSRPSRSLADNANTSTASSIPLPPSPKDQKNSSFSSPSADFSRKNIDVSSCPCYDPTRNHPPSHIWQNISSFSEFITSNAGSIESLYNFTQDLVENYLSSQKKVASLSSNLALNTELQRSIDDKKATILDLQYTNRQSACELESLREKLSSKKDAVKQWMHRCQELESNLRVKQAELELLEKFTFKPKQSGSAPNVIAHDSDSNRLSNDSLHPTASTYLTESNYRPRGRDPSEKFSGSNPEKYAVWRYEIDQKFADDATLFPSNDKKISYARAQLCGDLFEHMTNWALNNTETDKTIDIFFETLNSSLGLQSCMS